MVIFSPGMENLYQHMMAYAGIRKFIHFLLTGIGDLSDFNRSLGFIPCFGFISCFLTHFSISNFIAMLLSCSFSVDECI